MITGETPRVNTLSLSEVIAYGVAIARWTLAITTMTVGTMFVNSYGFSTSRYSRICHVS